MFHEGNYSCSCNRILYLNRIHGLNIDPDQPCSEDLITMTDFNIIHTEIDPNLTAMLDGIEDE